MKMDQLSSEDTMNILKELAKKISDKAIEGEGIAPVEEECLERAFFLTNYGVDDIVTLISSMLYPWMTWSKYYKLFQLNFKKKLKQF